MFSSSSPLGLCIDGDRARLVRAGRRGGRIVVERSGEIAVPAGVIENGEVRDPQKCAEVLRMLLFSVGVTKPGAKVVLCLPPEKVYSVRLRLPVGGGQEIVLPEDLARVLPEEVKDTAFVSQVLERGKEERMVGVVAVRTDVLQGYLNALKRVPLEVAAVTTVPTCLARISSLPRECTSFLLVLQGAGAAPVVTLFEHGWPCDEAVLAVKAQENEVLASVRDMLRDARARGRMVACLVLQVDSGLRHSLLELCKREGLTPTEALSELGVIEHRWVGAIAASLAFVRGLPFNFARQREGANPSLFVFAALLLALTIGVLWYLVAA